jgi:hypothetical protein
MHALRLLLKHNFLKRAPIAMLILIVLACMSLPIRTQSFRGSIRGQIVDASGAAIVGADVTAKNLATGSSRTVQSDTEGGYVLPELEAGEYAVTASAKDLVAVEQRAVVVVGIETSLSFTLGKVTASSQKVTVNAGTVPVIETTQDVLGGTVEQTLVAELLLNGRDFGKLVALVPGGTDGLSGAK